MIYKEQISSTVRLLQEAYRPVFIWGAGVRPYAEQARTLARSLGIPVACTWGAIDLLSYDHPLMAGGFGTHGTRAANFTVQNADLIISIGSRLDTKATGDPRHFARHARVVMVDIDPTEIQKFEKLGLGIDVDICGDAGEFLERLRVELRICPILERIVWPSQVLTWRKRYDTPKVTWPGINPYTLMKEIAQYTTKDDIICSDTGTALGYLMQAFPFKGERFLHAFNMTPMGYGVPAAVGASFSSGKRVILITGDGSLMMSLPELATVARWNLNIKIILLNNEGHAMCRQTQRQWLGGKYPATSIEGGLGFPDFVQTAYAFDVPPCETLKELFSDDGPTFLELPIHPDAQLIPQAKYGQPLEDADPQLPRDEFKAQMIVETL